MISALFLQILNSYTDVILEEDTGGKSFENPHKTQADTEAEIWHRTSLAKSSIF